MLTMTVEQSHIEHIHTQRQSILDQLKEITGVEDESVLEQALQASRTEAGKFDISQAVSILVDENATRYNQQGLVHQAAQHDASAEQLKNKPTKEPGGVIDLTNDGSEKEDLQRAIALSLQEQQHGMLGGQVTAEEQDISRVLEQSLAEAKAGTKRKRGEVWQDPLNPHERKRQGDWPVGLKNVGNTCWFSAVVQSLFHLPVFRHLVLNFIPPREMNSEVAMTCSLEQRNLLFMQELRRLFALMVGGHRKYVDPSKAVEILKEAFQSGSSDSQQDVSEFTHKLLEWLEDAFKSGCIWPTSPSTPADSNTVQGKTSNPMLDLFYGQFRSEGQSEGHLFCNEETFGQYPLQVNGFSNIHESLEAATTLEIETSNQESVIKSGQEHWFTKLPPVLLFELSRFQFNQQLGRPEKIHNKFDFPEIIYMDRYMEVNKNITKTKREEIRQLKEQRDELQSKLEKYLNYGSGSKRVPLQDVLQYALEFVESKPSSSSPPQDVEMASPCSNSGMNMDSPCSSPAKNTLPDVTLSVHSHSGDSVAEKPTTSQCTFPSPQHISDVELKVLQNCLKRWRTEVENDVRELQENIGVMDGRINNMYSDPSLQKVPYRLHAVLVHEGQAASGHYWAYVYDHNSKIWLKFNDITVTEASWDELQKESVGGYHNASAYCLMYIDCNKKDLVDDIVDSETGQRTNGLERLPPALRQMVLEDNRAFQKEIDQWDQDQLGKKEEGAREDSDCHIVDERNFLECQVSEKIYRSRGKFPLYVEHARISCGNTRTAVARALESQAVKTTDGILTEAAKSELIRLQGLANESNHLVDNRIRHIIVYMLMNEAPLDPVVYVVLFEQFAYMAGDEDKRLSIIQKAAEQKLKTMKKTAAFLDSEKVYLRFHEDYSMFREIVALFIIGAQNFHAKRYQESLPYLVNACSYNKSFCCGNGRKHNSLDQRLLVHYRRQCILCLNNLAVTNFDSEDLTQATEALHLMNDLVVPCMNFLSAPDASDDDSAAAEEIRSKWCSKLGEEITRQKQEHLQEFLGKLLDPSAEMKVQGIHSIQTRTGAELAQQYTEIMTFAHENGHLKSLALSR